MSATRFDCTDGGSRYCYGCYTMTESEYGDYVRFEDYDTALATAAHWKEQAEQLQRRVNAADCLLRPIAECDPAVREWLGMPRWPIAPAPDREG